MRADTKQRRKNIRKLKEAIDLHIPFTHRQAANYLGVAKGTIYDYMQEIRGGKTSKERQRERRNNGKQ